jgi:hypothetical protein
MGSDAQVMINILNDELECLNNWLDKKKLKLNISKTKMMWMNVLTGDNMDAMMDGRAIEIVKNMKYLGVHIDDKFKF